MLAVAGITNRTLRALMTGLLGGANYSVNQASYDLARPRVNGLTTRVPGRNRYRLTSDGLAFAIFDTQDHELAATPARRRPAAVSSTNDTKGPAHHRHSHHTTRRQCQVAAHSSLELQTTLKALPTKVRYPPRFVTPLAGLARQRFSRRWRV